MFPHASFIIDGGRPKLLFAQIAIVDFKPLCGWRLLQHECRNKVTEKPVIPLIQSLEQSIRLFRNWTNVWASDVKNRDCSSRNREEDAITSDDQMPDGHTEFFALRRERAGQRH